MRQAPDVVCAHSVAALLVIGMSCASTAHDPASWTRLVFVREAVFDIERHARVQCAMDDEMQGAS